MLLLLVSVIILRYPDWRIQNRMTHGVMFKHCPLLVDLLHKISDPPQC